MQEFSLLHVVQTGCGGPPNRLSNGYRRLFLRGVKRQEREADHSLPTSAEVQKTWIYTYVFTKFTLIFTFTGL
jgi:hypothetical protein